MKKIKSFELGSHKINIVYKKNLLNPDSGQEVLGLTDVLSNKIFISTQFKDTPIELSAQMHTFYHELSHYILILMNRVELNNDETFVDLLGLFISQFIKSKK